MKKRKPEKKLKIKYLSYILLGLLFLILFIFSKKTRSIIFVLIFIILNVFVTMYKRYFYFPIEFEILSLGIVLCSAGFGLGPGLVVAILGGIAMTIYCTSFSPFTPPMMLGYCLMAVIGAYVPISNIIYLGVIANMAHNLLVFSVYHFFFAYDIWKNMIFSVSNIVFNIIIFYNLGPFLFRMIN